MSERTRGPKIALDFDEVTVLSHDYMVELFWERHRVELPRDVYWYSDWPNPPLTQKQYEDIIFHHRTDPAEWVEKLRLMPGFLQSIDAFITWGLEIEILTSRGRYPEELEVVKRLLLKYDITCPVIGTAYQPKVNFLSNHLIVVDDQIGELAPMPPKVHRLLFSRPHNQAVWENPGQGIRPVRHWPHAVVTIGKIIKNL